jgi:radical SAM family uncharacterized protein/radical SAM-linked protein
MSDLLALHRPTRYLGGELGSIRKSPEATELTFALAFPDVYEVGMSHLGSSILYHILNGQPWLAAERVYAPWPDMEGSLRAAGEPLCSLESQRPLADFDILGFSLQYELSYTNILNMLDLAGIPRRRQERGENAPLLVVGGPGAYNPEPLADFIDCALLGDGEEAIVELCTAVRASKACGEKRADLLARLAAIEGVYVPAFFAVDHAADGEVTAIRPLREGCPKVRRRFLADLELSPYPSRPIVPFMATIHDRVALEIARGCTRGCRFCQAGYLYRPVRERSAQRIAEVVEEALAATGYEEVSLLSLSTGDYSCIEPLLRALMVRHANDRVAVSFPSLRVGSLTPELMEEIKKVRKTGFTLAPEAGTERLRRVINKGISEEDLLATTGTAFHLGWRLIKLYFMMGLPTETEEDLQGIIELAAQVKRSGKGSPGGCDVNVAVSTFVPKPHTPFQWERQLGIEETRRRQGLLRDGLRSKKLRLKWHEAELSFMEGVFARGDRRLGAVLEKAVDLGCRFDGWREHFRFDLWQQAFAACHLDPSWYLRARRTDELLPWAHLDSGVEIDYLLAERQKAFSETATLDCRTGQCSGCGVCDFEELRMRMQPDGQVSLPAAASPADQGERYKIRLRVRKERQARYVGHLEFMTLFQRAVRRAALPVRYSAGFHPAPRISFADALPTGVESDAEIIDLELFLPLGAREVVESLNQQLPEGVRVLEGAALHWQSPSPSVSIMESVYQVAIPESSPADLPERLAAFLAAAKIIVERQRGEKRSTVDLRPDVAGAELVDGTLSFRLRRGSPVPVVAYLLEVGESAVRRLGIRKSAVVFHP